MKPELLDALAEGASFRGADATKRSTEMFRLRVIEFIDALDTDHQAMSVIDLADALQTTSSRENEE